MLTLASDRRKTAPEIPYQTYLPELSSQINIFCLGPMITLQAKRNTLLLSVQRKETYLFIPRAASSFLLSSFTSSSLSSIMLYAGLLQATILGAELSSSSGNGVVYFLSFLASFLELASSAGEAKCLGPSDDLAFLGLAVTQNMPFDYCMKILTNKRIRQRTLMIK